MYDAMRNHNMTIEMPKAVKNIIRILENAGFEGYAVGGCVRDSLLGREPDDWDITTSAKPEQVKELFAATIDTGIQHGTVTVMWDHVGYEVTTYRIDGEYEDNRHPKEVIFTPLLQEDLRRRDFTINAMAYNEKQGLVDIFGGQEDLKQGVIRCVGEAGERFKEDALRIMRAVRFSAQLGYSIEAGTKEAIANFADNLRSVSAERIQVELVKLLTSPHPDYLRIAYETGITAVILPEFDRCMQTTQNNPHHCYSVGEHILHSMCEIEPDKHLRLAMLFHDIAKPLTRTTDESGIDHFHGHAALGEELSKQILHRLKFDNETIRVVSKLVRHHDERFEPTRRNVRRMINRTGEELFPYLLKIRMADTLAQSDFRREAKIKWIHQVKALAGEIAADEECLSLKTLAVTGKDLIGEGFAPGPSLGILLNRLLQDVLDEPTHNNKEYLLNLAHKIG